MHKAIHTINVPLILRDVSN
ncbi:hypothetical protein Hypma_005268 [Hypsizygus marmoreus]|uniref:Uncharacterized protein n=1 Tax=Hypsizygus marmoreus TaxID=39966 RepID=A0A369K751_HYPMA|nr:hypothetical protein Hypma_005268 [Hypsizygus marmoreus]